MANEEISGTAAGVFKWTDDHTRDLISWRTANSSLFTGKRNAALKGYETYIVEAGLQGKIQGPMLKRKWENLVAKYKELKSPRTGVSTEGGEATAASWKWYGALDEAMGATHAVTPVVLISSSAPCPPPAVASPSVVLTQPTESQVTAECSGEARPGRGQKRRRESELEHFLEMLEREKKVEENKDRESARLDRQRQEEKEAGHREEWRAEKERMEKERAEWMREKAEWGRERVQMKAEWAREKEGMKAEWAGEKEGMKAEWAREKEGMKAEWREERGLFKEREERLMLLLEAAVKK